MGKSRKSKGVKRQPGMRPGMKFAQRLQATLDDHDLKADSVGKIEEQDLMLIALKKMGILGPKRLMELHETLKAVRLEHYRDCLRDAGGEDRKQLSYTKGNLDDKLAPALGEYMVSWEDRHNLEFCSLGIRAIEIVEARRQQEAEKQKLLEKNGGVISG